MLIEISNTRMPGMCASFEGTLPHLVCSIYFALPLEGKARQAALGLRIKEKMLQEK